MPQPKRIVYLEGNVDGTVGGSYFSLLFLVEGLDRERFSPTVTFQREHSLLPRFRATADVRLVDKPAPFHLGWLTRSFWKRNSALARPLQSFQSGVNFLRFLATAQRYRRFLRRQRADLLHLNNSITRTHDWMLAARLARIPCVVHERGINERFPFPTRQLAPGLAAILCISQAAYSNLVARGFSPANLHVVPNGLDPARVVPKRSPAEVRKDLGVAADRPVIGVVGNIREWKGQEVLVRALPEIVRHAPKLLCLFVGGATVGDEAYLAKLNALIAEAGLERHVVFTGFTDAVADYLGTMDVAIHTSITPEPFGRVLLEAMAMRKPVVGSRDGAVVEIVEDGVTGYTFAPGDAGELAARVISLLGQPALARRMGDAGYTRLVEHFHVSRNVERTMAIYEQVFAADQGSR